MSPRALRGTGRTMGLVEEVSVVGRGPGRRPVVRLDRLTGEQEARLAELRDEWLAIGIATEPADRARAERAIRDAYLAAGLPAPARCTWVRSPLEGVLAAAERAAPDRLRGAALAAHRGLAERAACEPASALWDAGPAAAPRRRRSDPAAVLSLVDGRAWRDSHRRLAPQVGPAALARVWLELGVPVWCGVVDRVWAPICERVRAEASRALGAELQGRPAGRSLFAGRSAARDLRRLLRGAEVVLGQPRRLATPDRLAAADFLARVGGLAGAGGLAGLTDLARCAGWWWPHEDGVVLCDRPSLLALDAEGRLHSERGPAVRYRDGWAVWARHGEPAASNRPLARLQPPAAGPSGSSRS